MFLGFGLAALHLADRDLPMGTLMRMGPGNFPAALGAILAFFGLYLAARGLWHEVPGTPPRPGARVTWSWRPVACIAASMVAFAWLMPRLGMVAALVAMFFIAALGGREFRFREVLVLTVVMTAFAVGVFVVLLKLPFPLWPGRYLA